LRKCSYDVLAKFLNKAACVISHVTPLALGHSLNGSLRKIKATQEAEGIKSLGSPGNNPEVQ
jgi:hypothetical protein